MTQDRKPQPGTVVYADWSGDDRAKVKMRLVQHYEHPAGNGWRVNIYDPHRRRFSKIEQCVSDDAIAAAQEVAHALNRSLSEKGTERLAKDLAGGGR